MTTTTGLTIAIDRPEHRAAWLMADYSTDPPQLAQPTLVLDPLAWLVALNYTYASMDPRNIRALEAKGRIYTLPLPPAVHAILAWELLQTGSVVHDDLRRICEAYREVESIDGMARRGILTPDAARLLKGVRGCVQDAGLTLRGGGGITARAYLNGEVSVYSDDYGITGDTDDAALAAIAVQIILDALESGWLLFDSPLPILRGWREDAAIHEDDEDDAEEGR